MKRIKIITLMAALAIRVRLGLAAQDQPQPKQNPPAQTAAAAYYNFLIASAVSAAGAFTEKSPDGYIVTTGVWTATGLVSFESYGIASGDAATRLPAT